MVDDFVPADVLRGRMDELLEVVERSARARHHARVGRVERVLVDGPSKKDPAVLSGRTRQNKLVHFDGDAAAVAGAEVEVRITHAAAHWLRGEAIGVVERAAPTRTRIPVTVV